MSDAVLTSDNNGVLEITINRPEQRNCVNAAVAHALDEASAKDLMAKVCQRLRCRETILTGLSAAVAANLGPGTIGIVAYPVGE